MVKSDTSGGGNTMTDIAGIIADVENNILEMMRETSRAPNDIWEHFGAFSSSINWEEPFIRSLLGFHLLLYILFFIFWLRKDVTAQSILFFFITFFVAVSERLNAYCASNWRQFSTQNYFDKHGIFAGLLYSAPMLALCFLQLVSFLNLASSTLIKAKRLEFRKSKMQERKYE